MELEVSRLLHAPITQVWDVWTSPEHVSRWCGPEGFTTEIQTMDVVAGGEWRLVLFGPDGARFPNRSLYLEIIPQQKISFEHFNPSFITTITFQPQQAETLMVWRMVFPTQELFDAVVKTFKADEGLMQNVAKLERYLATC